MGNWDYTGTHGLNKYIWHRLKTELGWKESDYNGLIPITTPQQQPEFNALNKPYIVYSYSLQGNGGEWWIKRETAVYTIFSASPSEIRQAVNIIYNVLGRLDESAEEVNKFIAANGSADNKKFDYKSIASSGAQSPEPSVSEGGRHDGRVIVAMEYTHYDGNAPEDKSDSIRV